MLSLGGIGYGLWDLFVLFLTTVCQSTKYLKICFKIKSLVTKNKAKLAYIYICVDLFINYNPHLMIPQR